MKVIMIPQRVAYCADCPKYRNYEWKSYCGITKKPVKNYYDIPDWCPLSEVPDV